MGLFGLGERRYRLLVSRDRLGARVLERPRVERRLDEEYGSLDGIYGKKLSTDERRPVLVDLDELRSAREEGVHLLERRGDRGGVAMILDDVTLQVGRHERVGCFFLLLVVVDARHFLDGVGVRDHALRYTTFVWVE